MQRIRTSLTWPWTAGWVPIISRACMVGSIFEGCRKQGGRYLKPQHSKMFWPSAIMNSGAMMLIYLNQALPFHIGILARFSTSFPGTAMHVSKPAEGKGRRNSRASGPRTNRPAPGGRRHDAQAAWHEATVTAGQIIQDLDGKLRPRQEWRLEVTDEFATPLYVIHVSAERPG